MGDIADRAGVSLMTVSRVVNKKGDVNPETRRRVEQIIDDLGYRPSAIARSLATQRTGSLGLVVPDISNPYFSGIAHGVMEVANEEGFSVLLNDCEEDPERELEALDVFDEKRVDGVIVAAPRVDSQRLFVALTQHSKAVIVNRHFADQQPAAEVGYVANDDQEGGRKITEFLLSHGHRLIGLLAGPKMSYGSQKRILGYDAALQAAGLSCDPNIILYCPPTFEGGYKTTARLLGEHPEVTALFCFNDLVAIGALQACVELGRRVPEDLAVVGYDDIPMASWVHPALTTCRVLFEEMGRLAVQLLIDQLRDCPGNCRDIILSPEIVRRASAP
jgi:LacI family transcriptional regulator